MYPLPPLSNDHQPGTNDQGVVVRHSRPGTNDCPKWSPPGTNDRPKVVVSATTAEKKSSGRRWRPVNAQNQLKNPRPLRGRKV